MAHARTARLWVSTILGIVLLFGGYSLAVIQLSDDGVTTSDVFAERAAYFEDIGGLLFTSLEIDMTVGEPDPSRQQVGILVFPHADGVAGLTLANTFYPIGNLDVYVDMERVTADETLSFTPTSGGFVSSEANSAIIEYSDGNGVGPIAGTLQMTNLENRGVAAYPFDAYESRLLAFANTVQEPRFGPIPERSYEPIPVTVNVDETSQGSFRTYVSLLSTEKIDGGPRPAGGVLAVTEPLVLASGQDAFLQEVQKTNSVQTYFRFDRTSSTKLLAFLIYGTMIITTLSVLAVTIWSAVNKKIIGLSAAVWAVAVVFTILQARRILPGAPPIGIHADLLFFFPTLAVSATCAVLLTLIWIRRDAYDF